MGEVQMLPLMLEVQRLPLMSPCRLVDEFNIIINTIN